MQAINLFTITNYSGLDPEINRSGRPINAGTSGIAGGPGLNNGGNLGLDFGFYPISRQYLVGLNFEF